MRMQCHAGDTAMWCPPSEGVTELCRAGECDNCTKIYLVSAVVLCDTNWFSDRVVEASINEHNINDCLPK